MAMAWTSFSAPTNVLVSFFIPSTTSDNVWEIRLAKSLTNVNKKCETVLDTEQVPESPRQFNQNFYHSETAFEDDICLETWLIKVCYIPHNQYPYL